MQLTALELAGFKSFARSTRLEFGPGLTVVIGPNGSGKSNLAEAIRWVLGEQSTKQLRTQASTDIIFAGSQERARQRQASVKLILNNESGRFPAEAPEITIARFVDQTGESEYTINGDVVRLVDVQQMLAEAGIGAKSYTVISQGMVDRYLTATPETRRELFDEATGIRALQIRLQRTRKQLAQTQQHAQELTAILQELEPRLRVLARQVRKYEEREQIIVEFGQQQLAYFTATWHQAAARVQDLSQSLTATQASLQVAKGDRARVERRLLAAAKHTSPTSLATQELAAAQAEYTTAQKEFVRVTAEKQRLEDVLAAAKQQHGAAQAELTRYQQEAVQFDWFAKVKLVLRQCLDLLHNWDVNHASAISQKIEETLQWLDETQPLNAAQAMVAHLSKPLQQVAHFAALVEERQQQLAALPPLTTPNSTHLESLRQAAQTEQTNQPTDNLERTLEEVRNTELTAQRELSLTQAAAEQARRELANLESDIRRERGETTLRELSLHPLPEGEVAPSLNEVERLQLRLAALGEPDPLIQKEYEEVHQRFEHLRTQLADVQTTHQEIENLARTLETEIDQHFAQQFQIIQASFSQYFIALFGGGEAKLVNNPEGIEITIAPPAKRPRHVNMLSGGEKALTSLALLFAIIDAQQPPFLVLDEVDAALDEANSRRFVDALKTKSQSTQCIVISHNREMFAAADVLYGVTMSGEGISKVYSVKLENVPEEISVP